MLASQVSSYSVPLMADGFIIVIYVWGKIQKKNKYVRDAKALIILSSDSSL